MTKLQNFQADFKAKFPSAWVELGDFNGDGSTVLWSGEDNYDANGMPLFDYYEDCGYDIHPELVKLAEKYGYYFECYDAGTYIATEF